MSQKRARLMSLRRIVLHRRPPKAIQLANQADLILKRTRRVSEEMTALLKEFTHDE